MAKPSISPENSDKKKVDLALEGGGVKGIGLVGAVTTLASHDYTFPRVAGSSAGAIVGALTAACVATDTDMGQLVEIMDSVDYREFEDGTTLDRLGALGKGFEVLLHRGIYKGDYLLDWLGGHLEKIGVETFGQLHISEDDDPATGLPPDKRYRLVVTASDVTTGELVRIPWDCREHYQIDPDRVRIVDAVRASMSIPFFFQPYTLPGTKVTLVDGGMLYDFPVGIFDQPDPRWPTFGVKLSSRAAEEATRHPTSNVFELAVACLETLIDEHDAYHLDDEHTTQRTIFVDTTGVSATDFSIDTAQQKWLFDNGQKAAEDFLATWPPASSFSAQGKWLRGSDLTHGVKTDTL